jgi:hypothetical protein
MLTYPSVYYQHSVTYTHNFILHTILLTKNKPICIVKSTLSHISKHNYSHKHTYINIYMTHKLFYPHYVCLSTCLYVNDNYQKYLSS